MLDSTIDIKLNPKFFIHKNLFKRVLTPLNFELTDNFKIRLILEKLDSSAVSVPLVLYKIDFGEIR